MLPNATEVVANITPPPGVKPEPIDNEAERTEEE